MIKQLIFTLALLVLTLGLVSCGVKGPLYTPTPASPTASQVSSAQA